MSSHPAGWYPDNTHDGQQRYWDGQRWTQYVDVPVQGAGGRWRRRRKPPTFRPSAQLVTATYQMLFADRSMIALLFAGAVVAALVGGAIVFPAAYWGHIVPDWDQGGVLGVLVAGASMGAASFVFQIVSGAVVAAAILRAEGRTATIKEALRVAWARRMPLAAWALVSTFVGALIRLLERLGVGGLLAALTVDVGWSFATVFATPVIMAEGTMPMATVRRSAGLLRRQFTVVLISSVALELPWMMLGVVPVMVAIAGGLSLALGSGVAVTTAGVLLVALGVIGCFFFAAVSSALSAYLEALLYRYAAGLPVPGVDLQWLPPRRVA